MSEPFPTSKRVWTVAEFPSNLASAGSSSRFDRKSWPVT